MIELCSIGFLLGSCITYFVVIGDLGPQILSKIFGFNQTDSLRLVWMPIAIQVLLIHLHFINSFLFSFFNCRTIVMIIVTVFCIIPLCLLRNIESLSFMCITSIIFYFCLVIKVRMSHSFFFSFLHIMIETKPLEKCLTFFYFVFIPPNI